MTGQRVIGSVDEESDCVYCKPPTPKKHTVKIHEYPVGLCDLHFKELQKAVGVEGTLREVQG